jgi:hypothetical protein
MLDLPQARFERWLRERDVSWCEFLLMTEARGFVAQTIGFRS